MRVGNYEISSYGLGLAALGSVGLGLTTRYFKLGRLATGAGIAAPWVALAVKTVRVPMVKNEHARDSLDEDEPATNHQDAVGLRWVPVDRTRGAPGSIVEKCNRLRPGGDLEKLGMTGIPIYNGNKTHRHLLAYQIVIMAETFTEGSIFLMEEGGQLFKTEDHGQFYAMCESVLDELAKETCDTTVVIRRFALLRLAVRQAGEGPNSPWRNWPDWLTEAKWAHSDELSCRDQKGEIIMLTTGGSHPDLRTIDI